jgi:hypothetical protein
MRNLCAAFFFVGVCLTPGFCAEPAIELPGRGEFHLFLLVGQSNMAGRGDVEPQDREINPRVLALNANDVWVPAVDPIHFDKPGAGTGLARSFALAYLEDHPGVTVGLIPCACGGSPISTWAPGQYFDQTRNHPYDDAIRRARLAMDRGTLKAILWHQGESDCKPDLAAAYRAALRDFVVRLRRDLHAEQVPFIFGQLGRFDAAPWSDPTVIVDAATQAVAAESEPAGFVSSAGLTSKPDNLHFDAPSLREFGRRYYAVFRQTNR